MDHQVHLPAPSPSSVPKAWGHCRPWLMGHPFSVPTPLLPPLSSGFPCFLCSSHSQAPGIPRSPQPLLVMGCLGKQQARPREPSCGTPGWRLPQESEWADLSCMASTPWVSGSGDRPREASCMRVISGTPGRIGFQQDLEGGAGRGSRRWVRAPAPLNVALWARGQGGSAPGLGLLASALCYPQLPPRRLAGLLQWSWETSHA